MEVKQEVKKEETWERKKKYKQENMKETRSTKKGRKSEAKHKLR